jgi:hypothetical protein
MTVVTKKSTRYRKVASDYAKWLEDNPKASEKRKKVMFDIIADLHARKVGVMK